MLNHVGTQQLETNRLIIRRYEMSDVNDMYNNWVTDSEVCRFWSWEPHKNIDETKEFLAGSIKNYEDITYYNWTIVLKSASEAVGYIYLADIDDANDSASINFALGRKYWNKGIMTEACKCVLNFAFTALSAKRIHSWHHIDNSASGRVQQKSGMRYINTIYKQVVECERISGDYCYYEILYSD